MYQVLLVDDEPIDLQGLKQLLPWNRLQLEVVQTATNGYDAIDFLQRHHVDIMITDIQMPILTGLELSEKALALNPLLKVIFVSGYQDFQYAKRAISMKSSGYVLKPIDENELIHVLKTVTEELRHHQARSHMDQSIKPYLQNELIYQLLEGQADDETVSALMLHYGIEIDTGQLCAAVVEMDDVSWKLNHYSLEERERIKRTMLSGISDYLLKENIGIFCRMADHRVVALLNRDHEKALETMSALIESMKGVSPVSITAGMGLPVQGVHRLHVSYLQAKEALDCKMYMGKGKVISFGETRKDIAKNTEGLEGAITRLFTAVSAYDLVGIVDRLQELFQLVRTMEHKFTVYNFSMHIISKLDMSLRTVGENLFDLLGWKFKNLDVLLQFETIEDIESWMRRKLFEISERMLVRERKKQGHLIRQIEAYIDEHLEKKMTLRDVAEAIAFSPNYLGTLFKEGTGKSFSDYLIQKRMERALVLLRDSALKVYEISDRLGYSSMTYFNRQFKDVHGITPGDYRKKT